MFAGTLFKMMIENIILTGLRIKAKYLENVLIFPFCFVLRLHDVRVRLAPEASSAIATLALESQARH